MITAVDTNILLDVLLRNPLYEGSSLQRLNSAVQNGTLVICDVVASELGAHFSDPDSFERFLYDVEVEATLLSVCAAHDAGRRWRQYLKTRKSTRKRIVADFMIAAHAVHHADCLLTRDLGFYRRHFSDLVLA